MECNCAICKNAYRGGGGGNIRCNLRDTAPDGLTALTRRKQAKETGQCIYFVADPDATTTKPRRAAVPQLTAEEVKPTTEKTNYTLADLLAMEMEEEPCLFAPVYLKKGFVVLVGGSDTGKSSYLRQMCMCVATGRDFMGWKYNGSHHRAIYFSSEDTPEITARVVKKYNKTMQLTADAAANLRFEFDIDPSTLAAKVKSMLEEQPADLVVIDAFGDAFNGKNINDNTEIRKFYNQFKPIINEFDCLVIFNHHTGKRTMGYAPDKDNSLGSQAIEAAPRLVIELRQDPNDPEIKHLCIVKANYLATEYKTHSYAMKMDDNLVFAMTGERVEFANLAKPLKPEPKTKAPKSFPEDDHKSLISEIFKDGNVNQSALLDGIMAKFDISDKTARKFLQYYISEKWIKEAGKGAKNSVLYSVW